MAEKTLTTRILLKYDILGKVSDIESEKGWVGHNPKLLKGEVAVVAVNTAPTEEVNSVPAPQILFKVGDGVNHFNDLPWATGLAADVYDWAKAENKPVYKASEITGLADYISGEIQDTNTIYQIIAGSKTGMYQLQKKELNGDWTNEGSEFGIDEKAIKDLIDGKAAKTDAIGSFTGTGTDTITPVSVSGSSKTSFTINNVADASNVKTNINGHAITSIFESDGITAKAATKATQDGDGKNITSTYATKTELSTKVSDLEKLINPGMEFKGVLPASGLPTDAKKGDTYKVGTPFSVCKAGDAVIAVKDNPAATIDDINWSVIPAGDDVEDTWRNIKVNGTQLKGNGISTGAINFKNGSNVTISGSGDDITINATDTVYTHPEGSAANKAEGFYKISTDETSHVKSVKAVEASDITDALGYTPYNSTNPNGYTTNKGTVTSVSGTDGLKGTVTTSGSLSIDFDVVAKKTDLPTVNDGKFTVKGDGTSITGTGFMTANQATNTEAVLKVADYSNILTHKGGNNLQDEAGNTIIFNCGDSNF